MMKSASRWFSAVDILVSELGEAGTEERVAANVAIGG